MSEAQVVAKPAVPSVRLGATRLLRREVRRTIRYSQFVARAKLVLPLTAGALILAVAAWPTLSASVQRLKTGLPKLDASQLSDARMFNPRYTGLDRDNRPYTVTADAARENGTNAADANGIIALEGPKADILTKEGAWIVVAGKTGLYQPNAHLLDLFGNVTLLHDKGYRFKTASARVDVDAGTAEGHEHITGDGTSGTVEGEGFRVLNKGDTVIFTGKSKLVMNSAHGDGN